MQNSARRPLLVPVAVLIFALGILALAAIFVLYATGRTDLPLWLNISAGAGVPFGLGLALVGLLREARAGRPQRGIESRNGSAAA